MNTKTITLQLLWIALVASSAFADETINGNLHITNGNTDPSIYLHGRTGDSAAALRFMDNSGNSHFWSLVGYDDHLTLHDGSSNHRLWIQNNGNIGIGTTSPNGKLEVVGDVVVNRIDSTHNANLWIGVPGYQAQLSYNSSSGNLEITPRSGYDTVFPSGNIGVGTNDPSHKLAVNGSIRAKEVIVDTGWSDFVFEESYRLRSLSEVESHIEKYGHLPDVPSASLVESEGLSLGEAQKIMMRKIEELTLYMIDLKKENEALKIEIVKLKSN